jgi:hypothetical protein
MLVLYVGTTLIVWVGFNLVRGFLEKVQLREFDRQIGGLLGLAKGIAICVLITLFTVGLGTESQRQAVIQSRSGYYITQLLKQVEPLVPAEYRKMVDDAVVRLEDRSGLPRGTYDQGGFFAWGRAVLAGQAPAGSEGPAATAYPNSTASYGYAAPPGYSGGYGAPGAGTPSAIPPDYAQQIQNEILRRLQQSSSDPNLYTPENLARLQNEIQLRWQQASQSSGGGTPSRESLQQAFGSVLNQWLQPPPQPQQPPQQPPGYPAYPPPQPGYGYGS